MNEITLSQAKIGDELTKTVNAPKFSQKRFEEFRSKLLMDMAKVRVISGTPAALGISTSEFDRVFVLAFSQAFPEVWDRVRDSVNTQDDVATLAEALFRMAWESKDGAYDKFVYDVIGYMPKDKHEMLLQYAREGLFVDMHQRRMGSASQNRGEDGIKGRGVYAILYSTGLVKVGKTTNFLNRLAALSTQGGAVIVTSDFYETEHHSKVERLAHKGLAQFRRNGEFFEATLKQAEEVIRYAMVECQTQ